MPKGNIIKYSSNTGDSYVELKTIAENVIALTSAPYTWSEIVTQGSIMTAIQMNEIIHGIDAAYDAIVPGCSSNEASVNATFCNFESTNNTTVNASQKTTVYSSHYSSRCSSANSGVKSSNHNQCVGLTP